MDNIKIYLNKGDLNLTRHWADQTFFSARNTSANRKIDADLHKFYYFRGCVAELGFFQYLFGKKDGTNQWVKKKTKDDELVNKYHNPFDGGYDLKLGNMKIDVKSKGKLDSTYFIVPSSVANKPGDTVIVYCWLSDSLLRSNPEAINVHIEGYACAKDFKPHVLYKDNDKRSMAVSCKELMSISWLQSNYYPN